MSGVRTLPARTACLLLVAVLVTPASCTLHGSGRGRAQGSADTAAVAAGAQPAPVAPVGTAGGRDSAAARSSPGAAPARVAWRPGLLRDRLVVKFVDAIPVRLRDGQLVTPRGRLAGLDSVLARYPDAKLQRLHSVDEGRLDRRREAGMRRTGQPLPDLNNYYLLRFPAPTDRAVELANALLALDVVETAYLEAEARPPGPPGGPPAPPEGGVRPPAGPAAGLAPAGPARAVPKEATRRIAVDPKTCGEVPS
jgi:hypothetical protein